MKKIEEDRKNRNIFQAHELEELLLSKHPYQLNNFRFNVIFMKIKIAIIIEKIILKFTCNHTYHGDEKQS